MEALLLWVYFAFLAIIICVCGYVLSYFGDFIAEETGLGRNLMGVIFLAAVTSMPELMSGVGAIRHAADVNLAVGDIFGSCVFNLFLVFVIDLLHRGKIVFWQSTKANILTGSLGMIIMSYVGFVIVARHYFGNFTIFHVGISSLFLPLFYWISMRMLYQFEQTSRDEKKFAFSLNNRLLMKSLLFFILATIGVVICGIRLPVAAEKIMHFYKWNSSFMGTLFLAFTTSLPEIAVTYSALRLGASELALSNILGSNLFNMVILTFDDFVYLDGALLSHISDVHLVTIFSAIMMTGLVLIALLQPPQKRVFNTVTGLSLIILSLFIFNNFLVYKIGE